MAEENLAIAASHKSWDCVRAHDKDGWLALMADDVCMEDPIGVAPTNPDGKGIRGKEAISAFWDKNMAAATIGIETHRSYAAGSESAHLMTLTTSFENGVQMIVNGIFTYQVDDDGKLTALRGYWSLDESEIRQPS